MSGWEELLRREREQLQRIDAVEAVFPDDDQDILPHGEVWTRFNRENAFLVRTNFTEQEVTALVQLSHPHFLQNRRRGPQPKSTEADSILCYLVYAKFGTDYETCAALCHIKAGRFEDNVARARAALLPALAQKWWAPRARPTPLAQSPFPHAALLLDTTTIEVFRPKTRFEDAKTYWDGHNKIYGLKKEVAVAAQPPHYCMFSQRAAVGSVHDYSVNKDTYPYYVDYLHKSVEEHAALAADRQQQYWAVLCDKAYIGPEADTPNFRRLTPIKPPRTVQDHQHNAAVARFRVPVDQFFGRMWKKWGILRNVYRFDHAHFDSDFDVLCLLTNEGIAVTSLSEEDALFYDKARTQRRQLLEAKEAKLKEASKKYKENKRRRLNNQRM